MGFRDYFSGHARDYASYRPGYPDALFSWLAANSPEHNLALDCATGNGQAAVALAGHFRQVIATDASARQLAAASTSPAVTYICATAEHLPLADTSVDLVSVAQGAHWFDMPAFNQEAGRVLRRGGLLALWWYGLFTINPDIDAVIQDYYRGTLEPCWPAERDHIDTNYQALPFPYAPLDHPAFRMSADWDLDQVMGYLATWSATRLYIKEYGNDPLPALRSRLQTRWGDPTTRQTIHWPLQLRAGTKP